MREPREFKFESADGTELNGRWWARPSAGGSLVIGHGLGEHGGLYEHVAQFLFDQLPLAVLAFDFRGHGRSEGRRGYARRASDLSADWSAALGFASRELPHAPCFALGHSYGGLAALAGAFENDLACRGLILSNPALRIRMAVPALKVAAGRLLRVLAPWVTLAAPLPVEHLTSDPDMQQSRRADALAHNRISAPLYFGMREAARRVLEAPDRFTIPLLLLLAPDDPIIDAEASRTWFDQVPTTDKAIRLYPGSMHEPLADVNRHQVLIDIVDWLRPRIGVAQA